MSQNEFSTKLKYDVFLLEKERNEYYRIYRETGNDSSYREYEACSSKIKYIQQLLEYITSH